MDIQEENSVKEKSLLQNEQDLNKLSCEDDIADI